MPASTYSQRVGLASRAGARAVQGLPDACPAACSATARATTDDGRSAAPQTAQNTAAGWEPVPHAGHRTASGGSCWNDATSRASCPRAASPYAPSAV